MILIGLLRLVQVTVYPQLVEKLATVANAMRAKNHSRIRMNPLGSFKTSVFMAVVPIG